MADGNKKCIIILSTKSSGSSALQNLLAQNADISFVESTRHNQNETLYWTKAASILGLPQVKMYGSEVPIPAGKAEKDLKSFLQENLKDWEMPEAKEDLIFKGWHALAEKYAPIFLEKSPHHLLQKSSLELMAKAIERLGDIDFLVIGLIRNPADVMYSYWTRWRLKPEKKQHEWVREYLNIPYCEELFGDRFTTVRYEDMTGDLYALKKVWDFVEVDINAVDSSHFHRKSVSKWKKDKYYSFNLDEAVLEVAESFGYERDEMVNENIHPLWGVHRAIKTAGFKTTRPVKNVKKILKSFS